MDRSLIRELGWTFDLGIWVVRSFRTAIVTWSKKKQQKYSFSFILSYFLDQLFLVSCSIKSFFCTSTCKQRNVFSYTMSSVEFINFFIFGLSATSTFGY